MTFEALGLSDEVLRAVNDSGYTDPTPIQRDAIPVVLMGRDVLGCAQTGTGKTASFTLPMIDILASGQAKARMPRSLILEPTRELAAQVADNFTKYTAYQNLNFALLIGGERMGDQQRALDRGVDVLIATPGRLLDLYERGNILLSDCKILVIDEADRMLDMGFIPDIERIVGLLPRMRQTLFFSATMPPAIRKLADAFLINPKEITVAPPASPAATVAQHKVVVAERDKREALRTLIKQEEVTNAIIFCNRKRDVDILVKSLTRHKFDCAGLHGDMAQPARMATLEKFRDGEVRLLVASDVAARGLDIPRVGHVFNFDVPVNAEDYIHRIGRTGRAGRSGRAFTLVSPDDNRLLGAVEAMLGQTIEEIDLPNMASVDMSEGEGDSHGRGRGRSGGASKPRGRGERSAPREATPEPEVVTAPTEQAPAEPERQAAPSRQRERGRGGSRRSEQAPAASSAPASPRAPREEPQRHGRRDDVRDGSLGFGDNEVPAFFLQRSIAPRPSSEASESA
jgi:superfamily II DNA/RNA helicase